MAAVVGLGNWTSRPHLLKRMKDRGFNEGDVRAMLEDATDLRPSHEPGRFVIECHHDGRPWEVVVEPDADDELLVVVTAYAVT